MVVIKQSFKAFLTKHKLDDAPAAARADDDDDYQQGKIESVALETGYRSSPRAREKFMISAEGQPARAPPAPSAPADAGSWTAGDAGVANPAEPAEAYRVVHAVVMVRARPSTLAPRVGIKRAGDVVRGRVLKMASTDNEWLKLDGAVGYVLLHGRSVGCGELLRREAEAAASEASEAAPAEAPEAAEADGRRLGEARFTVAKDWKERLARAVATQQEAAAAAEAAHAPANTKAAPSTKAAAARAPVKAKAAPSRKAAAAKAPAAEAPAAAPAPPPPARSAARDPLGVYVWRRALAYAGCARTLGAAACCSDVLRRAARDDGCWWPAARRLGARDAANARDLALAAFAYRSETARGRAVRAEGRRAEADDLVVSLERTAPHAALFALDAAGDVRVRRDRVSKGGPIGASWRRFRGRARVGDCFAKFAAIAEQRVPFMDRNLCDKLPCSVVIAPYAEERVVDDFALKGRSRAGGLAVLPLEYRGLVLGPLLLGTFGFTAHTLVNRQQQGVWFAALPHAPNHFSPAAPRRLADGELRGFSGVAVSTSDGPCELEGSYAHLNAKAAPATASLRQLGAETARRCAECGLWAAATLDVRGVGGRRVVTRDDRTVFDQACVATLAVLVDDERGRASWSRAKLIGRCQDCDGAAKWVFEGPAWDADAPEPRDLAGRGHLACLLGARAAETFTWPPELRPADCDAMTLEGEFVSGTFVLQAALVASPRHRVRVALFALAPCD